MTMLPALAMMLLITPTVEQSYAQVQKSTHPDVQRLSPSSFGIKTADRVCGDKLCSEIREPVINIEEEDTIQEVTEELDHMPDLDLLNIIKYRKNSVDPVSHVLIYKITGGTLNLADIAIEASSDINEVKYNVTALSAEKSTTNVVRIMALDPDSINVQVVGYTLKQ